MSTILTLTSDLELEKEFLRNVKRREIEQKFIYLGDNANKYYNSTPTSQIATTDYWKNRLTQEQMVDFIISLIPQKNNKIAFVSLGCGQATIEAMLMKKVKDHTQYKFFGIDSSKEMLDAAEEKFIQADINGSFFCADFSAAEFHFELKKRLETEKFDQVIFLLIGSTLGNVSQTEIVDTLYNLLEKDDIICLDIMTRPTLDKKDDLMIFNAYSQMLKNESRMECLSDAVYRLGIPRDDTKIVLKAELEGSIGVLCFQYSVEILSPTVISYRGERIHLLPPEQIKFLEIRTYHIPTMISYFKMHDLELFNQQVSGHHGQFAFVKTD
ncbi:MAG: L-histidine N(alpha)-methyltransferase [Candidatus Gracilibacteria bacterium]